MLLSAYLDGALADGDRAKVEALLRRDADLQQLLEDLRANREALLSLPRHSAPATLLSDIRAQLERQELLSEDMTRPVAVGGGRSGWWAFASAAAMVGIVALGTYWVTSDRNGTSPFIPGAQLAMKSPGKDAKGPAGATPESSVASAERAARPDAAKVDEVERHRSMEKSSPVDAGRDRADKETARTKVATRSRGADEAPSGSPIAATSEAVRLGAKDSAKSPRFLGQPDSRTDSDAPKLEGRLLALADAERKIDAGIDPRQLVEHPFANESLRLAVTAASDRRREAMVKRLVDDLASLGAEDVESVSDDRSRLRQFYVQGKPGKNFASPGNEVELLVRVRADELPSLVDRVCGRAAGSETVALESGPVVIVGRSEIRATLQRRATWDRTMPLAPVFPNDGSKAVAGNETEGSSAKAKSEAKETPLADSEWLPWGGLFPLVGIDPAALRSTGDSVPAETTEDASPAVVKGDDGAVVPAAGSQPVSGSESAQGPSLVERRMQDLRPERAERGQTSAGVPIVDDRFVTLLIRFDSRPTVPSKAPAAATPGSEADSGDKEGIHK
ncbi:MAG: hypothetical protein J5J06_14105 [Phycisphaerae bacterium]|nr:hypothetical protein [Phycisphaerae bacterium]